MSTRARVAVLPRDSTEIRIEELTLPEPGPYQVEVRQLASGICHSQLHQVMRPRMRHLLLGHESCGYVTRVGALVRHVEPGDPVLLTWIPRDPAPGQSPPQGVSLSWSGGEAFTNNVFTWADVTLADAQYVVRADHADSDVTSVIGCAVITGAGAVVHSADVQPGDSVAVIGAGGVGLCAIAAASQCGADPIIAIDLDDEKLAAATRFGATVTVNGRQQDAVKTVQEQTSEDGAFTFARQPVSGVDYAFDCIGSASTIEQMLGMTRKGQVGAHRGGTAVLVGLPGEPLQLDGMDLILNEKSLIGSAAGSCIPEHDIPEFLGWHQRGLLDLDSLVSRRYRLEQINEAITALQSGEISGRAILEF